MKIGDRVRHIDRPAWGVGMVYVFGLARVLVLFIHGSQWVQYWKLEIVQYHLPARTEGEEA